MARSLAAQLALAVSAVHSQGYVHGDLHLGNILLQLPSSLNTLSVELLYAQFGAPELEPVVPLKKEQACPATRVPPYAVPPVWLGIVSDEVPLSEAKLLLSDFGGAFRPADISLSIPHTTRDPPSRGILRDKNTSWVSFRYMEPWLCHL